MLLLESYFPPYRYEPDVVRRYDGVTGAVSWEYHAAWDSNNASVVSSFAIASDGRVYVVERGPQGVYELVALDGASGGTVGRWTLGPPWAITDTTGPIVHEDGSVVLFTSSRVGSTRELRRIVLGGTPSGLTSTAVDTSALTAAQAARLDIEFFQPMPDGQGGWLLTPNQQVRPYSVLGASLTRELYRVDANAVLSPPLTLVPPTGPSDLVYQTDVVLGEDAAWAYVEGRNTNGYYAKTISFDPVTLAVESENTLGSASSTRWDVRIRSAVTGGGIYLSGPSNAFGVGLPGSASGFASGGNGTHVVGGLWTGWGAAASVRVGDEAPEAISLQAQPSGAGNRNAGRVYFDTSEAAALGALDFIYLYSAATEWEWGGLICQQGSKFMWSPIVTDRAQDRVQIEGRVSCNNFGPFGVAVARFHTHPPIEINLVPSDGDIGNANDHPELVFYLRGSVPGMTQTTRYQKTPQTNAQSNLFKLLENGSWQPIPWP